MKTHQKRFFLAILAMILTSSVFGQEEVKQNKWLDDYPKHVGLTWNADIDFIGNYIWRGLYVGGLGVQTDCSVGYGGAYLDMWWNVGATDWAFKALNPEVDMTLGFSRWGLTVQFLHMYYFDKYSDGTSSRYFDFKDPADGVGGITTEWRLKYKISSKLPLTILIANRTFGRDGYFVDADGKYFDMTGVSAADRTTMLEDGTISRKRAYSTYVELGYDWALPYDMTLTTQLGFTPWRSMYTGFTDNFAVNNVKVQLGKSWETGEHVILRAYGVVMVNPWRIATEQAFTTNGLMLNAAFGISFK